MTEVTPVPKTKRKPKRLNQTKVCDGLFGKIIRSRGACEIETCGQTFDLQCAHGWSRGYRAVRWDERNAFCLCRGCHLKYTMRPIEWDDWLRQRWGDELYAELRTLALTGPNPNLAETRVRLRERARELEIAA